MKQMGSDRDLKLGKGEEWERTVEVESMKTILDWVGAGHWENGSWHLVLFLGA